MGYRTVETADVEPTPDRPCELRRLTEAAGLEHVALNRYSAAPGEEIPLAYHYHDEQEEAFYVIAGEIAVETPEGTFAVSADELFAADPDSPHRAYCPEDADEAAEVLAVGAPQTDGDVHVYEPDGGE
ncbi:MULTISPECIES: cupin domain-containing protein [Halolamina]|uniref:Mannose-6-phosphate isomerase, cupin superfamily n=1 Tax=Halolamina pelagica TaxID=699431 RepID=A0A1I5M8I4_9EURY|nr:MULTISPECIES: cupin domain-containing protein [Halolamina]NHX35912.1 cupin domain-containing protein [Halolamina sp. R1-12]SFP05803.1 Mannose-6-phosphate isomerase, cupin superfamily [Halolamina pelagica]